MRSAVLILTALPGAALAHPGEHLHPHGIALAPAALFAGLVVLALVALWRGRIG